MEEHKPVSDPSEYFLNLFLLQPSSFAQSMQCIWEVFEDKVPVSIVNEIVVVGYNVVMLYSLIEFILFLLLYALGYDFYRNYSVRKDVLCFVDLP
jgi:hypothetical protein